jgi:hypothetical protein
MKGKLLSTALRTRSTILRFSTQRRLNQNRRIRIHFQYRCILVSRMRIQPTFVNLFHIYNPYFKWFTPRPTSHLYLLMLMFPCTSCDYQCKSLLSLLMLLIVIPCHPRSCPTYSQSGSYLSNDLLSGLLPDSIVLCFRTSPCCWYRTLRLHLVPFCSKSMLLIGMFMHRLCSLRNVLVSQISIFINFPCKGTEVDMKSIPIVGCMLFWDFPVAEYKKDVLPTLTSPIRMTMKIKELVLLYLGSSIFLMNVFVFWFYKLKKLAFI